MSSNIDYALAYSDQGFWVVPIVPGAKNPALPEWEVYTKRKPTRTEIIKWWKENPNYGVGFITGKGSRICVLDIDRPEKIDHYLDLFPTGLVAKSSKGVHLYYHYPAGFEGHLPNRYPDEGVDFRGDNGIIVAPPTLHPSGVRYSWQKTETPGILPDPLLNIITGKSSNGNGAIAKYDKDHWLNDLLRNGSQPGNRDIDGTRLAGYFVGKGLPRDVVLSLMMPWYERTDKADFPLSQVEKIVDSISSTSARRETAVFPNIDLSTLPKHISPFSSFVLGPDEELSWLIEDWVPQASTGLMVAPPGHFKTWLMIAAGMSVSSGQPLFGKYKVSSRKPVLIIQQEDSKSILRQRMRTVYAQLCRDAGTEVVVEPCIPDGLEEVEVETVIIRNMPDPDIDIYTSPMLVHFSNPESMRLLELLIDSRKYGLVFIDPLYMSAEADNYMAKAAQEMGSLKRMRDTYGVTFIVLHHTRKTAEEGDTSRLDAWGSQFLNAWLEVGYQIRTGPDPNSVILLRHFKGKKAAQREILSFDIDTDPNVRKFSVSISDEDSGKNKTGANVYKAAASLGAASVQDIAALLTTSEEYVRRSVRKLLKRGVLFRNTDGTISPNLGN